MFSNGFSELVLIVNNVCESAAFYRDVVRLVPEMEADSEWAWFWAGEVGMPQRIALHAGTLLFEEYSPLPAGERWGRVHFALNVSAEKLEAAAAHVRSTDVQVYGPQHFSWMHATSYYFYDPDGNLVEFWSPEDRTADAAPASDVR